MMRLAFAIQLEKDGSFYLFTYILKNAVEKGGKESC